MWLICFGLSLLVIGSVIRLLSKPIAMSPTIKQLHNAREDYARCNRFKNWYYDRFLETGNEYQENQARYWQTLQVYQRGRWSVLFARLKQEAPGGRQSGGP